MTQHSTQFTFEGFDNPTTTPVPDIVFDRLLTRLGEAELKALLYIIRRTFGFKRNQDPISFNQFIRGITTRDGRVLDEGAGIRSRSTLSTALKSLEAKSIILSAKGVDERGENETTVYSLHFKGRGVSPDTTPERVVRNSHYPGTATALPVVRNSYPQQTGLQQTDRQQTELVEQPHTHHETDVNISKFRKGTTPSFVESAEQQETRDHQDAPSGFEPVSTVLAQASDQRPITNATAPQKRTRMAVEASKPSEAVSETIPQNSQSFVGSARASRTRQAAASAPAAGQFSEEREQVAAYIGQFGAEFHDQASVKSSTTRAMRLLEQSGLPRERWSDKLYEARTATKERSAAIGYQGDGKPRAGVTSSGLVNKMPYYFELLACALGLHNHPAGEHPMPLSTEEFKRRSKGGRPNKVPSEPQKSLQGAWAEGGPPQERGSLAGKYKHLVR